MKHNSFLFTILTVIIFLLLSSYQSIGQSVSSKWLEKSMSLETEEKNPAVAKKELIEKITVKISEDLIKEMIGEAKFNRNNTTIQNKLIKYSARFIPVTKPSELLPTSDGGFKLTLSIKVSQDDLQSMLLENGLLYESDSTPLLLPVISITDKVNGKIYGWWLNKDQNKSELMKHSLSIENSLKQVFAKNGFYVIRPQTLKYENMIPYLDSKNQDWQAKAQELNAQILLLGDLVVTKNNARSDSYQLRFHITATQVQNGRTIADVVRTYETDSGAFDFVVEKKIHENIDSIGNDLSSQVFEAWQKGTIGSSLYKLTLNGNLPIQTHEAIKASIKENLKEIKNIKERLVSYNQVVFEIDTSLTPKDIKAKLPKLTTQGYTMSVEDVNDQEIQYKIKKDEVK